MTTNNWNSQHKQQTYLVPTFEITKQISSAKLPTHLGFDYLIQTEGKRRVNGEIQVWRFFMIERHYDGQIFQLPGYGYVRIK